MKKTIGIIIILMTGLTGVFAFLALNENIKGYIQKKEREIRERKMAENYDEMMAIINGSKPKIKMVKC